MSETLLNYITCYPGGFKMISETVAAITQFLFIGKQIDELGKYKLILVLGNDDITGTISALRKILSHNCLVDGGRIILSGNVGVLNKDNPPEADRLLAEAVSEGISKELFILDTKATNTLENFRYSKEIIVAHGGFDKYCSILCIGKAFMMRRAKMCALACDYPIERMDFFGTVDRLGRNIGHDSWWKSETARIRVLEELRRIAEYALKGDIRID